MAEIAVIGSGGLVGNALCQELKKHSGDSVSGVTRENYSEKQAEDFDIIINCAMPSGKFWANNNPEADFEQTVKKTADLVYKWKYKKFIQISTVSARCQLNTVYGRHKAAAEQLCNFGENLTVRLGVIYSKKNTKGPLADMLEGKTVFTGGASRQSFISLDFCARWLAGHLDYKGVVELGGKNAITLETVAKHLGKKISFEGEVSHLDVINADDGLPEAKDVLEFLDSLKK